MLKTFLFVLAVPLAWAALPGTLNAQTIIGAPGQDAATAQSNGAALQTALDNAALTPDEDTILLLAGAQFAGPIRLPVNNGGWITVQSSDSTLPGPGTRVSPADASKMPKLLPNPYSSAPSDTVLSTAQGAGFYRFVGVEITTARYLTTLVVLGTGRESAVSALPHHITFDRCYVHGSAQDGSRRGIAANAGNGVVDPDWGGVEITNSYFSDFKDRNYESQAVAAWNGAGPFRLVNNYFEASGENVMFGGADPAIQELVPSDIDIRRNHFYKPLSWQGQGYIVKNLFELKNARRVHIEANVFQNNWTGESDQRGFAILFTPRNQDGRAPWSVVKDVNFVYNKILNAPQGMTILGRDDIRESQQMENVVIRDNLFKLASAASFGVLFQVGNGPLNVTIDHNTGFSSRRIIFAYDDASDGFVFTNNITPHNLCDPGNTNCGIVGDSTHPGDATIARYFPGGTFAQNVIIGGDPNAYKTVDCSGVLTCFPATQADLDLNPDYSLGPASPYKRKGTDGRDIGAQILDGDGIPGLTTRTAGVVQVFEP